MDARGIVVGVLIGGVLGMGIASGQGNGDPTAQTTPAPGSWVLAPMEAKADTFLANHGYCRKGLEVRQVQDPWIPENQRWTSTHYRCRPIG